MVQYLRFLTDEEGATALEYGLLAAFIGAAIIASVQNLGTSIIQAFTDVDNAISSVIGGGS